MASHSNFQWPFDGQVHAMGHYGVRGSFLVTFEKQISKWCKSRYFELLYSGLKIRIFVQWPAIAISNGPSMAKFTLWVTMGYGGPS